MTADFLALHQVSLRLGRSPRFLLQDISFELQPGEVAVLLGNRGSGKSLLLQLLNGLKSPSQGEIQWQGQLLSRQSPMALRRQIAWLPQQPRLLGMTGKEAIAYPLQLQGKTSREIQQRLDPWLDLLPIPLAWLEQRELMLSQPAVQAIALIRALAMEPQLLLLDNPWPQSPNPAGPAAAKCSPPSSDSPPLPAWNPPQERINLALSAFTQAGGAVIWAMQADQLSKAEPIQSAQRLLCLAQGRLTGNHIATAKTWHQVLTELTHAPGIGDIHAEAEAEEWD